MQSEMTRNKWHKCWQENSNQDVGGERSWQAVGDDERGELVKEERNYTL